MTDQSKQRRRNRHTCKACDGQGVFSHIETVRDWRGHIVWSERVHTCVVCFVCRGNGEMSRSRKLRIRRLVKAGRCRIKQWLLRMGRAAGIKHYPPLPMPPTYGITSLNGAQWASYGRVRHKSMLSRWIPCPFNCRNKWIQEFELNGYMCHVCGGKKRVPGVRTWEDVPR